MVEDVSHLFVDVVGHIKCGRSIEWRGVVTVCNNDIGRGCFSSFRGCSGHYHGN